MAYARIAIKKLLMEKKLNNRKSKLLITFAILLAFTSLSLSSCAQKNEKSKNNGKLNVVCTIFPEYDWAKNIIRDNLDKVNLSLVVKNGVDLHSYQPSTADIVEITSADIFIYVGGISDNWVTDVLANSANKNMKIINLMELLGDRVQIKEVVEGMQACEHDHGHTDSCSIETENTKADSTDFDGINFKHTYNEPVYDEHVWLSLQNAKICCTEIAKALCESLPDYAEDFNNNLSNYTSALDSLDNNFKETVSSAREKTIIVCDRFPFRYLVEDYNLNYYAAFAGCSAETEASFATIAFLAKKLQETGLNAVITIDNSDNKIAETVIQNAKRPDCKILTFDSMQSTTLDDALGGKSYIGTMTNNLKSLKTALL